MQGQYANIKVWITFCVFGFIICLDNRLKLWHCRYLEGDCARFVFCVFGFWFAHSPTHPLTHSPRSPKKIPARPHLDVYVIIYIHLCILYLSSFRCICNHIHTFMYFVFVFLYLFICIYL